MNDQREVTPRGRRPLFALLAVFVAMAMVVPSAAAKPPAEVAIQILGLNDFHGQLEWGAPTASSGFRLGVLTSGSCVAPTCYAVGGVEYLSTHVNNLRATNPNSVFVSAGDLIGATPLLSAAFHDEPTIEAFNLMGLDYNGVGNHEFDEGVAELKRMQDGGCHPVDGCGDGDGFAGADFQFLAANVVYKKNDKPIFKPYKIHTFQHGVKVAFIGMTLEGTPLIVSPGGIASVNFLDEAATVNALIPEIKAKGVETIVVLLHEGGSPSNTGTSTPATSINSCNSPGGALPPIVAAMDDEVDVVITGHTNWAVNCLIDGKVVTGAASQGRLVTDIDLTINRATGEVSGPISVNNHMITRDVAADPALTALIAKYNAVIAPIRDAVVGHTTDALTRTANAAGESTMGRLIADAQLASTQSDAQPGVIAFMNPGGMRADIAFTAPGPEPITHGEAFSVQPFSNIVTTKTFTGQQIKDILEQQFKTSAGGTRQLILPVSAGFTYTWTVSAPVNNKVSDMKLNGVPISLTGTYRVTANNFLAGGGDDFPGFTVGTAEQTGLDDLVALEAYLGANDPYTPLSLSVPANTRITRNP